MNRQRAHACVCTHTHKHTNVQLTEEEISTPLTIKEMEIKHRLKSTDEMPFHIH